MPDNNPFEAFAKALAKGVQKSAELEESGALEIKQMEKDVASNISAIGKILKENLADRKIEEPQAVLTEPVKAEPVTLTEVENKVLALGSLLHTALTKGKIETPQVSVELPKAPEYDIDKAQTDIQSSFARIAALLKKDLKHIVEVPEIEEIPVVIDTVTEPSTAKITPTPEPESEALPDKDNLINSYVDIIDQLDKATQPTVAPETSDSPTIDQKVLDYINEQVAKLRVQIGHAMEAGGGTIAVQYANGGTMNGDLVVNGSINTTGQYLSAGQDIDALLTQTLSFDNTNNNLTISNANTVDISSYLHNQLDVLIPSPLNNQVLTYNSAVNQWTTGYPTSAGGATGYYGSFYDNRATQYANPADALQVALTGTYESNGVVLSANRMYFANPGTYMIQFSIMYYNATNDHQDVNVWFNINGTNSFASNSIFTLVGRKNPSIPSKLVAVTPFIVTLTANSFVSLHWYCDDSGVYIASEPAHINNPSIPSAPGVIVTAHQVTNVQNVSAAVVGSYLPLSGGTVGYLSAGTLSADSIFVTNFNAVSANITVIDIKQYELSGFGVTGNVTVSGNLGVTQALSSQNTVYAAGGNSTQWNATYTAFSANSGNYVTAEFVTAMAIALG